MKFVIDDKIPYIQDVLEPYADVKYIPGALISSEDLKDADALIIRTRTKCNRELLEGSSVKFIATATIGFDHIDSEYCKEAGIEWTNAPGCNAESVNQYIVSVITLWWDIRRLVLPDTTIGIVGVGNVGSRVAKSAEILGLKVLLNDPPRARKEGPEGFVELSQILEEADFISLHVPLNMEGEDKTFHMVDREFINKWKNPEILINSCRGEVIDSKGLLSAFHANEVSTVAIDCWENEPDVDPDLLDYIFLATPHIAGYSRDGKANGTSQSIKATSKFFNLGIDNWYPDVIEPPHIPTIYIDGSGLREEEIFLMAVQSTYSILHDDHAFRTNIKSFEKLRGDYPVRREFHAYKIICSNINQDIIKKLNKLGFKIN